MSFDPRERYFTIQVKSAEATTWSYYQGVADNGRFRFCKKSELLPHGDPLWVEQTHFSY